MFKVDPSAFFSGSGAATYKPSKIDIGVGYGMFHSIMAMKEYQNLSNEEIRMEDYDATCGLFGSPFIKICAAVCCVEPKNKPRPYVYGECFRAAIGSLVLKEAFKRERNEFDERSGPSVVPSVSIPPMRNDNQKQDQIIDIPSKRRIIIRIGSEVIVNVMFKDKSDISAINEEPIPSEEVKAVPSKRSDTSTTKSSKRTRRH